MSETNEIASPKAPRSLVTILTLTIAPLSMAALVIAAALQLYFNFQSQQQIIAREQTLIASEAAQTVSSFIQTHFNSLVAASRLGDVAKVGPVGQQRILDSTLGLQPALRQMALLDQQGQEVARASRLSRATTGVLTDQAKDEAFNQAKQGQQYISPVYIDDVTSEPLVILAVPVTDVLGEFQGVILGELNLKFMWDLVDQIQVGQTGYAYVVDDTGRLLAFGDIARVLRGDILSDVGEVQEFLTDTHGQEAQEATVDTSLGINGTTILGTYVPLGKPDWAVVTEMPLAEAYQPIIQLALVTGMVILAVSILAAVFGIYIIRRLVRPMVNLTGVANRIAAGEFGIQAETSGPAEIWSLAQAFNRMTAEQQKLIINLEQRSRAVEISAEVSRRLSTILNERQLVTQVVEQVRAAYDYYYAHIYIFDEANEKLVMAGGTGEAGQAMLARGHSINKGQGLVGRAAETNTVVLVQDVAQEEGWLPNPLLPDTKAEVAVPISLGEEVLGVLDVQHSVTGSLTQAQADLLQGIANQVAIILRNARVYARTQRQVEREVLVNTISQKIQGATTVDSAMQIAVRELGRALGKARTQVRLQVAQSENGQKQNTDQ